MESDVRRKHNINRQRKWRLIDLPMEILLFLFSYLDVKSLSRFGRTNKHFHRLYKDAALWARFLSSEFSIIGASSSVDPWSQCRLAHNFSTGTFFRHDLVKYSHRELPWVRIDGDFVFSTRSKTIEKRPKVKNEWTESKRGARDADIVFYGLEKDATKFVVRDGYLYSGCLDGSFAIWRLEDPEGKYTVVTDWPTRGGRKKRRAFKRLVERYPYVRQRAFSADLSCLDVHDGLIVAGSHFEHHLQIWRQEPDDPRTDPICHRVGSVQGGDRFWSVAFSPDGTAIAGGSGGYEGAPPLRVWTVESKAVTVLRHAVDATTREDGVLHVYYESPHVLVSAGYDAFVRFWDLRSGNCVSAFYDDFQNETVYAARSDSDRPLLVTGSARYTVMNLWDKRHHASPFRTIYGVVHKTPSRSSPVYSLDVDGSHIYCAYDYGVLALNFDVVREPMATVEGSYGLKKLSQF